MRLKKKTKKRHRPEARCSQMLCVFFDRARGSLRISPSLPGCRGGSDRGTRSVAGRMSAPCWSEGRHVLAMTVAQVVCFCLFFFSPPSRCRFASVCRGCFTRHFPTHGPSSDDALGFSLLVLEKCQFSNPNRSSRQPEYTKLFFSKSTC